MPATAPAPAGPCIGGLTPFTSIDYPGKLSAVVYLQGCPWRCAYCHNQHLQARDAPAGPDWSALRTWLQGRRGLLDAVVFSGGEPTLDGSLAQAMDEARAMGFAVGLHSAGMYPRRLRAVLSRADWVGLDVKAPLDDDALHERITGVAGSAASVRESLRALIHSGIAHEVRTTAHASLLDDTALLRLADNVAGHGVTRYALQLARVAGDFGPSVLNYPAAGTIARLRSMFAHFTLRGN